MIGGREDIAREIRERPRKKEKELPANSTNEILFALFVLFAGSSFSFFRVFSRISREVLFLFFAAFRVFRGQNVRALRRDSSLRMMDPDAILFIRCAKQRLSIAKLRKHGLFNSFLTIGFR